MIQTIAIHDVRPEHLDAFRAFMGKVEAAVAGAPGLGLSSERDPAWTDREDELLLLAAA